MAPNISVIVPIYKAENYIFRCVDSILSQTFTDFELILVDDGSPDKSGALCDEYALHDDRIRVIHQQNRGAAAARNAGIDCSRGTYLAFCDSDDIVSPEWLKHLVELAEPDVFPVCSYCQRVEAVGQRQALAVPCGEKSTIADYFDFNKAGVAGYLCNGLYNAEVIKRNKLRIREHRDFGDYNEDLLFNLQYVEHMKSVVYNGYCDYCYVTRGGSLSRSYQKYYFRKYEEKFWLWYNFISTYKKDSQEDLVYLSDYMIYHFLTSLNSEVREKDGSYKAFRDIVCSGAVQECLKISDCPKENPKIISLMRKQAVFRLWLIFSLKSKLTR